MSVLAQGQRDVQVDASGLPLLSFGELLTFIIRLFFFIAGIAALVYGLWGALSWITSGGSKEEIEAARNKIQAAIVGVFILIVVLSIIVALEQFVFNEQLCFGLSCPVRIPGLKVFPLDARTANEACTGMGFPDDADPGRTKAHYCRGSRATPNEDCDPGDDKIDLPVGKTISGPGCTNESTVVCCVP